jgi:GNAT superfamily N-acetyltransferase
MISDGYHDVPAGKIAAVVTYLEMHTPPAALDAGPPEGSSIRRMETPRIEEYRDLFHAIGEHWLWFSRLRMSDHQLATLLLHPAIDVFFLECAGRTEGLLELDRREFPDIELAFFGLTPRMIGKGAGRFLIQQGIREAFAHNPRRLFLHTCTLDHPKALGFYAKAGFRAYKRAIEVAPDPRLTGSLPKTAAPQIPIIE